MDTSQPFRNRPQLALGEDVFFCVSEGQGIFLDLTQDDYCAIPIPAGTASVGLCLSDGELLEVFEPYRSELIEARLLVECVAGSSGFQAYTSIVRPGGHIFGQDDQRAFGLTGEQGKSVHVSAGDVIGFFWASWRASRLLKKRHIREVVRSVRSRKEGRAASANDASNLERHVRIFRRLRPWYPAAYLCLYDALALVEFLALKKIHPTWVFGVQAQPFGAHCWLQQGDLLLNETSEYAGQFTPIMAV